MGGFRLRTIEVTAEGRQIVRDRDLAQDRLSVGRAADNALHLPDLALDPHHAVVALDADGRVRVESVGTLGFGLDGRTVTTGVIDPAGGGELDFGGYRVAVGRDEDGAVLLTVAAREEPAASAGFTLSGLLPGRRAMSWGLVGAILALFLAWPIWSGLSRDPGDKASRVAGDAAWSTGPLSFAHRTLSDKCEACHVKPFEAVRDQTCLTCHKDDAEVHAAPPRLASARGPGGAGDRALWRVAHAFGKPGPGACSDCHTEHEGAGRMPPPAQAFCAECHEGLKDRLSDTRLGNAADFGRIHPQFQPRLALTLGSGKLTRVSLDRRPREASGLAFPHDKHLNPRGGVARMAARLGGSYGSSGLACKDCHRPTADGVRFLPIEMERDCGSCHSLAYDKVGATVRRLRHGDVPAMIADLSASAGPSRPIVSGRSRPGEYANTGRYYARFTPVSGAGLAAQALSKGGICGECHLPSASGGRFGVVPVTQVTRFFAHGWFTHAAHRQEKCTSCHTAEKSASSADLLLPDLKSCRTCHLGEDAAAPKVPSGCAMCHDYHASTLAPRGTGQAKKR